MKIVLILQTRPIGMVRIARIRLITMMIPIVRILIAMMIRIIGIMIQAIPSEFFVCPSACRRRVFSYPLFNRFCFLINNFIINLIYTYHLVLFADTPVIICRH